MPLMASLLPAIRKYHAAPDELDRRFTKLELIEELQPVLMAFGTLAGEAHDYILAKSLAKVERLSDSGKWERVWDAKRGLIVDGIDGADVLTIAIIVVAGELASFAPKLVARIPVQTAFGGLMH